MALATSVRSFRVGNHLKIVVGLGMAAFMSLGLAVFLKNGSVGFLVFDAAGSAILCYLLASLRMEISRSWFKTTGLTGSRTVHFGHVIRAWIEVVRAGKSPQGAPVFWITLRNGQDMKLPLRVFPIEAAARIFSRLEEHGVHVEVSDEWMARRMSEQVRRAQQRIH